METLQQLVSMFGQRGDQPAIIALRKHDREEWSYARIADLANRVAAGFAAAGMEPGARALLFAPNSAEWIIACLALLTAGLVPVPVDTQIADEDLQHVLADSDVSLIVTTDALAQRVLALAPRVRSEVICLDTPESEIRSWWRFAKTPANAFPQVNPADTAVLFYTSGTTGRPKGVPLTHRNLVANHSTILALDLVSRDDRLLLPLPLHHVYAFTAGMLAPLGLGVPVVLPASLTGPEIVRALKQERATLILAVPRFYEALLSAMETRMRQRGRLVTALYQRALAASVMLLRRCKLRVGRFLFAPIHWQFAPDLRLVASAGAALDPALAWQLAGLGWQVAIGYGLTETSPLLTYKPPEEGRLDTAGKPVPGVDVRFALPEPGQQYGEVLVKGLNVFSGYRHLPDKTQSAFTADGYFRTGDVGYVDTDGYLHLVGRASEMIVLAGGENIRPDMVENVLIQSTHIREAGVLESQGRLVALIVPQTVPTAERDTEQINQEIRSEVEHLARTLPSHHRLSDYALSFDPLPRTRLGKLRRHVLAQRYEHAKRQHGGEPTSSPLTLAQMAPEDRQLLEDVTAQQIWAWLVRRFPNVHLTPDSHLQLDLGIDSLTWLTLTLEIRHEAGVDLDEEAISRIETVRDLLREAVAAEQITGPEKSPLQQLQQPETLLSDAQQQWLQPPGLIVRALRAVIVPAVRLLMRSMFQLRVSGRENLPERGPFILTPNHVSFLDPLAVGAALPAQHLQLVYWGGWTGIMFTNPVMRLVSRASHVVPIDPQRGSLSNLAFGIAALQRGHILGWFPEGGRSQTGKVQPFRSGIGLILTVQSVPVVPVWIAGTYVALPPGTARLRRHPITVTFGKPLEVETLLRTGSGEHPHERITAALQEAVVALGDKRVDTS
ncbi:MAG: AMP-binding protein [Candidatus Binatia bacterium]